MPRLHATPFVLHFEMHEFFHFILRKPKRNVTCAATARRIRHQALLLSITSETRGTTLIVFPYIE